MDTVDFPTLWGVRFHPGKFEALSFLWPSGFYPDPGVGLYPFLCANSRAEQLSDAELLQRCGSNLNASPSQAPVVPVSDQRLRGLDNLKWSFLFFMVGGALTFVPFVGLIAGLFYILAFVFLIVGWSALGRSTLAEAPRYKSTGSWLIYSIIIAVVVAVIGSVIVFFLFLSSVLAHSRTSKALWAMRP